jgi:hypothetical protein
MKMRMLRSRVLYGTSANVNERQRSLRISQVIGYISIFFVDELGKNKKSILIYITGIPRAATELFICEKSRRGLVSLAHFHVFHRES